MQVIQFLAHLIPAWVAPWLYSAIFFAVTFGVRYWSARRRTLRTLRAVEVWPISDAIEGFPIRITGRVVLLDRHVEAPLSGRACAYYLATVGEYVRSSSRRGTKRLVERIRESDAADFLVEDAGGRARIQVTGAPIEAAVVMDHSAYVPGPSANLYPGQEERFRKFLVQHRESSRSFFGFPKSFFCSEGVLAAGETVTVLGTAMHWEDDPSEDAAGAGGHYRESARRKRLVIEVGKNGKIVLSDEPEATLSARAQFGVERPS